jgi:hypothetical protein
LSEQPGPRHEDVLGPHIDDDNAEQVKHDEDGHAVFQRLGNDGYFRQPNGSSPAVIRLTVMM